MAFKKLNDNTSPKSELPTSAADLPSEDLNEVRTSPQAVHDFPDLVQAIKDAGDQGVSMEDAERLAAKFLNAMIQLGDIGGRIRTKDLNARLKKAGWKTIKAKVYLEACQSAEKKPTEAALESMISTNTTVSAAEDAFHTAEVDAESLHRLYDIFREAHLYFRAIAKGNNYNG